MLSFFIPSVKMIKRIIKKSGNENYVSGFLVSSENLDVIAEAVSETTHSGQYHIHEYLSTLTKFDNIAFLDQIFVDKRERNKGYGNQLIQYFLKETSEAECIFLLAPLEHKQETGISLEQFYEKHGFIKEKKFNLDNDTLTIMIKH